MNKSELLNGVREEYRQWEALLNQIGEARMDQPGAAADWSIKDIVAHLTGWRRRTKGNRPHPGQRTSKLTRTSMQSMRGSMSPIMAARCARFLMNRITYFSRCSLPSKVYPMKS